MLMVKRVRRYGILDEVVERRHAHRLHAVQRLIVSRGGLDRLVVRPAGGHRGRPDVGRGCSRSGGKGLARTDADGRVITSATPEHRDGYRSHASQDCHHDQQPEQPTTIDLVGSSRETQRTAWLDPTDPKRLSGKGLDVVPETE